jgi:hypothetical protein
MIVISLLMRKVYMKKINAKKRMMFVQNDDYNYLCYVVILTLGYFSCFDKKTSFKDYRKIAFISNIIFFRNKNDWNDIYYKSQITQCTLLNVIAVLDENNIIGVDKEEVNKKVNIWLKDGGLYKSLIQSGFFSYEQDELLKIKSEIKRFKSLTLKTFLDKKFLPHGVSVWEV